MGARDHFALLRQRHSPAVKRAETAVRIYQSYSPTAAESFCRLARVDYRALDSYMGYSESALRGLQSARDSNGVIVRAVLARKFPAHVTPQAPETFIPDTRSAEEKLRDAKASGSLRSVIHHDNS